MRIRLARGRSRAVARTADALPELRAETPGVWRGLRPVAVPPGAPWTSSGSRQSGCGRSRSPWQEIGVAWLDGMTGKRLRRPIATSMRSAPNAERLTGAASCPRRRARGPGANPRRARAAMLSTGRHMWPAIGCLLLGYDRSPHWLWTAVLMYWPSTRHRRSTIFTPAGCRSHPCRGQRRQVSRHRCSLGLQVAGVVEGKLNVAVRRCGR
jgi:hypothetical protein